MSSAFSSPALPLKTKEFSLEVKALSDGGIFEGYASTFGGEPDSYGDIIARGAFSETLRRHRREGTMPLMFFGHDASELPIGDWLELAEDETGLWGKGQLDLDDPVSARVHRALKAKRVRGLSIGYRVPPGGSVRDDNRPGVTLLKAVDLIEISVVNMPANKRSLVNSVKSISNARDIAELLHEAGLSDRQAKAAAGAAWKAINQFDDQAEAEAAAIAILNASAARIAAIGEN